MKKIATILMVFVLLLGSGTLSEAVESKQYPNEVNVSIHLASSLTMNHNSPFQLYNKETAKSLVLPSDTVITVKKESTGITVSYPGFKQTSTKGFDIKEISSVMKMVVVKTSTPLRKGATTSYESYDTLAQGTTADYLGSFTNGNGELWYNVTTGGYKGWVLASHVSLENFSGTPLTKVSNGLTYRGSFHLNINGSQVQVINYLDMEDYLKGVVPSEMPASWPKEAVKAQAIAARSYAANMMSLTSTAASQVYRGYTAEDSRSNTAIKETEGMMVRYNGKPIQAFFHSTSGGRTANVWDVWNSSKTYYPYLASVSDPYEKSPYSDWEETFTSAAILKSFGFSSTTALQDIIIEKKGANGEIGSVTVKTSSGEKTISGNENVIRKAFPLQSSSHYNSLYSNWFTMSVAKKNLDLSVQLPSSTETLTEVSGQKVQTASGEVTLSDSNVSIQTATGILSTEGNGEVTSITLKGKGWGHRIGMSQYGAKGFAERGWTAESILKHYFTGTTVSK